VITASHAVRGYALGAALVDELAFFPSDDASISGAEIVAAIRPAMATIPDSLLICASSPYARRGPLWDAFRRYHGKDDASVLVWQAPTLAMNPSVPRRVIDEAFEADPASAAAEYGAAFRTDVESYIAIEAVMACVSLYNGNGNGDDDDDVSERDKYIARISNAWRTSGPYAWSEPSPRMMGPQASPGNPSNGGNPIEAQRQRWLKPGATPGSDAATATKDAAVADRDVAYIEYIHRLTTAWKRP
jgi:hypothetical protein